MRNAEPAVRITAAVSATHRPMLKRMPLAMPGSADGNTTLVIVCHLVPPKENPTSRYREGTQRIASSDVRMIVGRIITAKVSPPDKIDHPNLRYMTKKIKPNSPYTIEGIPDSDSAQKRIIRANLPS